MKQTAVRLLPRPLPILHRVTASLLPGQVGQRDALEVVGVVAYAELHATLDLVGREVTPTPDDISIASAFEPGLYRRAAFRLPLSIADVHLLDARDAIALSLQPRDLFGRNKGIDNDAPLLLAITDDDDPELGSQFRQVATVASRHRNMIESQSISSVRIDHCAIDCPSRRST